jgi:hypothetical protein
MIQEFARCYNLKTGTSFDVKRRQIRYAQRPSTINTKLFLYRCLAHIINLATQAVISTHSKSKYYSRDPEDDTVPEDVGTGDQDEIGIIQAICVKVSISSNICPSFLMCGTGSLFLTTQAALQVHSRAHQNMPLPTVARYESALEFDICYAHSC